MGSNEKIREIQEMLSGGGKKIAIIVILLLIFLVFLNPFVVVGAGERGVVLNFGAVQDNVLGEGLHFRIPIMQAVEIMDVKIHKSQTEAAASTKDLQDTHSVIAVNHHIVPDKANWVYQHIGTEYQARVLDPAVQESVKAVTARYTAEELITHREDVSREIKEGLKRKLTEFHISVVNFSIVNFSFSKQYIQAIEDKQTAEQRALKAQQDLKRVEIEAQQKITQAKAEAESLRLQRQVISNDLIRLRQIEAQIKAIDKWNGQMPSVTGGALPFLNVKPLD